MLTLKKVAITGGLSCGKSSVCRLFKELGAHVVSADEIVHQLLSSTKRLGQQVIELLGDDIVVDGKIDRNIIAKKVFEDKILLHSLEKLIHPVVLNEIEKQYQQISNQGTFPLFIAEIPLYLKLRFRKILMQPLRYGLILKSVKNVSLKQQAMEKMNILSVWQTRCQLTKRPKGRLRN